MKGIAQLASRVCLLQPIEAAEAACEPRIEPANAPAIEKTELVSVACTSPPARLSMPGCSLRTTALSR